VLRKQKNTLLKSVYDVMEYTICNILYSSAVQTDISMYNLHSHVADFDYI